MPARKKFLLRISPALWDELNRWAAREFRSVNGQIEFVLQRAVDERRRERRERRDDQGRDAGGSGAPAP